MDFFAPSKGTEKVDSTAPWLVIVADDDDGIHRITDIALADVEFEGQPLQLIHTYSAQETFEALKSHPETALVILDVIMETENAGFNLIPRIREELGNSMVRIVLRTGQSGVPAMQAIREYDINDYKDKLDMSQDTILTMIYSCLRSFKHIRMIDQNKRKTQALFASIPSLLRLSSFSTFVSAAFEQFVSVAEMGGGFVLAQSTGPGSHDLRVVIGTGAFQGKDGLLLADVIPTEVVDYTLGDVINGYIGPRRYIGVYGSVERGTRRVIFADDLPMDESTRSLFDIMADSISTACENLALREEMEETQREMVSVLGEAIQTGSIMPGSHVRHIAETSYLLALGLGLSEREAQMIRLAAPLHDIGRSGIPNSVMNSAAVSRTEQEEMMREHPMVGYRMLSRGGSEVMQLAAQIALQHHENWDGSGYPFGSAGPEIGLPARIVAVADRLDMAMENLFTREPWSLDKIVDSVAERAGTELDPMIVSVLKQNIGAILASWNIKH